MAGYAMEEGDVEEDTSEWEDTEDCSEAIAASIGFAQGLELVIENRDWIEDINVGLTRW